MNAIWLDRGCQTQTCRWGPGCPAAEERNRAEGLGARVAARVAEKLLPAPGLADVVVTERCNHRCDYCFVKGKNDVRSMWPQTAEAAVEFMLRASRDAKVVHFVLFGGEPLVVFDLIRHLVDYAQLRSGSDKVVRFDMTTNGTLMTEEMAAFLSARGIKYLLSVDGGKETHDAQRKLVGGGSSFDEVMSRLPMMKRYQPWQGSRVTVHPESARDLYEGVRLLYGRGINQFIIGPATGIEWTDEALAEYERQMQLVTDLYVELKAKRAPFRMTLYEKDLDAKKGAAVGKWGCGAGRGRLCIGTNGDLYGCAKILGVSRGAEVHKLGDVWTGITNVRARRDLLNCHPQARPKCAACEWHDECSGGCPATNWEATGSIFQPAPLECRFMEVLQRVKTYYHARLE